MIVLLQSSSSLNHYCLADNTKIPSKPSCKHGRITQQDKCSCFKGYAGSDCSIPVCFGLAATSKSVCGGVSSDSKKKCIAPDTCSSPSVLKRQRFQSNIKECSNHGETVNDKCICSEGYYGDSCQYSNCYDTATQLTCSDRGTCSTDNICICNGNDMYGERCQYTLTEKIYLNDNCDTELCKRIAGISGDAIPAKYSLLNVPTGIYVDETTDFIFFADQGNSKARVLARNNFIYSIASISSPTSIAMDQQTRDIYIGTRNGLYKMNTKRQVTQLNSLYVSSVVVNSKGHVIFTQGSFNKISKIVNGTTLVAVAGTGDSKYNGDNKLATSATVGNPSYLGYHAESDTIYFMDRSNRRLRKITSNGYISTIAGGGQNEISNSVNALSLELDSISDTFVDQDNVVYFAENENGAVWKIQNSGTVTKVFSAMYGVRSFSKLLNGDFVFTENSFPRMALYKSNSSQVIYLAGQYEQGYDPVSTEDDNVLATTTTLNHPRSLYIRNDELYFADTYSSRVRKINLSTGMLNTIAGTGEEYFYGDGGLGTKAGLNYPYGIHLHTNNSILIADTYNSKIRKLDSNLKISSIAGSGYFGYMDSTQPLRASFNLVVSVLVNKAGDMFISDYGNNIIRKMSSSGAVTTIIGQPGIVGFADNSNARRALLNGPFGLYYQESTETLFFADSLNGRIRKFTKNGAVSTVLAALNDPREISFHTTTGHMYFTNDRQINVLFSNGSLSILNVPGDDYIGLYVDSNADHLYASSYSFIYRFSIAEGHMDHNQTDPIINNTPMNCTKGCEKGECLNGTCVCKENYGGEICDRPICFGKLSNDSSACNSHGVCQQPNVCYCYGLWEGDECTKCKSGFTGPNCGSCIEGFAGDLCNIPVCYQTFANESSVCSGHGSCNSPNNCTCVGNWQGENCQFCKEGFTGSNCDITVCYGISSTDNTVCSGHGYCSETSQCICKERWMGEMCQECLPGYTGSDCDIPICFGSSLDVNNDSVIICSGHGNCSEPDFCICNDNWSGKDCSSCREGYHGEECSSCAEGYSGEYCDIPSCFGLSANESGVCSGNGYCFHPDLCSCFENWMGETCNQCSGDYVGDFCDIPICYGVTGNDSLVCSGHGSCVGPSNCSCFNNWQGALCEICPQGFSGDDCKSCDEGHTGDDCTIPICYGIPAINDTACSGNGKCVGPDNCVCYGFWTGESCYTCPGNYSGVDCGIPICYGIPSDNEIACSGHGKCVYSDSCVCSGFWTGEICDNCPGNYSGPDCNIPICYGIPGNKENVCSGHGTCIDSDNCVCDALWAGEKCDICTAGGGCDNLVCYDIPAENETVCSGHGKCVDSDSCVCSGFWTGEICDTCPGNYSGEGCDIPTCYGVSAKDSMVCSGHGYCMEPSQCVCEGRWAGEMCDACLGGYTGSNCDVPICFGEFNESVVCSGHGMCSSPDVCECKENWAGEQCAKCNSGYFGRTCELTCDPDIVKPTLSIKQGSVISYTIGTSIALEPVLTIPFCYGGLFSSISYSYVSSSFNQSELVQVDKFLVIGESSKSSGTLISQEGEYSFKVIVLLGKLEISSSFEFIVKSKLAALTLDYSIPNMFTQSYEKPLEFEVKASDPSFPNDLTSGQLSLTCWNQANQLVVNLYDTNHTIAISKQLSPGQYSCQASFKKDSRSITKSIQFVLIDVSSSNVLTVTLKLEGQNPSWVNPTKDLIISSDIKESLTSSVSFEWKSPLGSFSVSPLLGYSLTTNFIFSCGSDWVSANQDSLTFTFIYRSVGSVSWKSLTESSVQRSINMTLPSGTWETSVSVSDSFLSYTVFDSPLVVQVNTTSELTVAQLNYVASNPITPSVISSLISYVNSDSSSSEVKEQSKQIVIDSIKTSLVKESLDTTLTESSLKSAISVIDSVSSVVNIFKDDESTMFLSYFSTVLHKTLSNGIQMSENDIQLCLSSATKFEEYFFGATKRRHHSRSVYDSLDKITEVYNILTEVQFRKLVEGDNPTRISSLSFYSYCKYMKADSIAPYSDTVAPNSLSFSLLQSLNTSRYSLGIPESSIVCLKIYYVQSWKSVTPSSYTAELSFMDVKRDYSSVEISNNQPIAKLTVPRMNTGVNKKQACYLVDTMNQDCSIISTSPLQMVVQTSKSGKLFVGYYEDPISPVTPIPTDDSLSVFVVLFAIVIPIVVCCCICVALAVVCGCAFKKWKAKAAFYSHSILQSTQSLPLPHERLDVTFNDINVYNTGINSSPSLPQYIQPSEIKLLSKLGSGGYGRVHKAFWKDQLVAVKCTSVPENSKHVEIPREAELMYSLKHPNIVECYGISIKGKEQMIVMEYVNGNLNQLIGDLCRKSIKMDLDEKLDILLQISTGMNYLHQLRPSIVHRDLTPANILFDPRTKTCKICDFGLSKPLDLQNTETKNRGTIYYIPNELIICNDPNLASNPCAIDVYSFSILAWQLLFEDHPYLYINKEKLFLNTKFKHTPYVDVTNDNLLARVATGLRPVIPFNSDTASKWTQKYMKSQYDNDLIALSMIAIAQLVQNCWNLNPHMRPTFQDIFDTLQTCRNTLSSNHPLLV